MQAYARYFEYVSRYLDLVYNYYSKDGSVTLCNYFNINMDESTLDLDKLESGPYRYYGSDNSGIKFTFISLLPVYYVDGIQVSFTGDERGYIHEATGSITFPKSYGIYPYEHDLVQFVIDPNNIEYPKTLYTVVGIEISNDVPDMTFYRCHIKSAPTSLKQIAPQITSLKTWYEPTKQILPIENALKLYNINQNIQKISESLLKAYDKRSACPLLTN